MSISLITHAKGLGTTSSTNTTGANIIVLAIAFDSGATVSDSLGNVWTPLTAHQPGSGDSFSQLYYCYNPRVGASHTFTVSISYGAIFMQAFSGVTQAPRDAQSGGFTSTSGNTTTSAGTIRPSSDGELIVCGLAAGGSASSIAVDSGLTITDSTNAVTNVSYGGAMAYSIQTTASAVSPTFSWTGSTRAGASSASFRSGNVSWTAEVASPGITATAYSDLGLGMFLHFNEAGFTTDEVPTVPITANTFNPSYVINSSIKSVYATSRNRTFVDHWIDSALATGCKYIVLTTKHHGGYPIWPSATADKSGGQIRGIANPSETWYGGANGFDIVADFVAKCRAAGIKVIFYFSIRDDRWTYDNESNSTGIPSSGGAAAFKTYVKAHLNELLAYSPDGFWFDGWGWAVGYTLVPYATISNWVKSGASNANANCLVIENNHLHNGTNTDVDVHEFTTEYLTDRIDLVSSTSGPQEIASPIRGDAQWFWHTNFSLPPANTALLPFLAKTKAISDAATHCTFTVDIGPMPTGMLPDESVNDLITISNGYPVGTNSAVASTGSTLTGFQIPAVGVASSSGDEGGGGSNTGPHPVSKANNGFIGWENSASTGQLWHSDLGSSGNDLWIDIDLGSSQSVTNVALLNRGDSSYGRLRDITITVSSTKGGSAVTNGTSPVLNPNNSDNSIDANSDTVGPVALNYKFPVAPTGRWVRATRDCSPSNSSAKYLALSQMQVFTAGSSSPITSNNGFFFLT